MAGPQMLLTATQVPFRTQGIRGAGQYPESSPGLRVYQPGPRLTKPVGEYSSSKVVAPHGQSGLVSMVTVKMDGTVLLQQSVVTG